MALRLRWNKSVSKPDHALSSETGPIPRLLAQAAAEDEAAARTRIQILEQIIGGTPLQRVRVRLWTGAYWPDAAPKDATIVLKHPGALKQMLIGGSEVTLAEAYLFDAFDVEGDIEAAFELGDRLAAQTRGW